MLTLLSNLSVLFYIAASFSIGWGCFLIAYPEKAWRIVSSFKAAEGYAIARNPNPLSIHITRFSGLFAIVLGILFVVSTYLHQLLWIDPERLFDFIQDIDKSPL
jgi:hypothetical protein